MNRFAAFLVVGVCVCLSGCVVFEKQYWIPAKFPDGVHIESPECWFIMDTDHAEPYFYYWKNTKENQAVFQEWLNYTRKHRLGTMPFMYGLYVNCPTLRFSKNFAWTCSSANRPYVEFSADNWWTMRRANKYDRKLQAIVLSLMTKDNMMTKEDAQKIKERYWK